MFKEKYERGGLINNMEGNMIYLYKQLSLENQRNEFSSLLIKTEALLNTLLEQKKITNNILVKNYNSNMGEKLNESEVLAFFYEDLWTLKNKILLLLAIEKNRKI